ncbi:MAG: hypothetical protein EOP49_41700 [Sphingobacteriales bacterium]|nr:MAG: hypothetical protein EOP49_41700 [Sphingobacteriales bacterium]
MNNNLLPYSPEHYRERLSAYAAYTIDVVTPVGTFTQKANREDNVTVVDEGDGYFRIYLAYYPFIKIRNFNSGGFPEPVTDYFAKIRIDDDVRIQIFPAQTIDMPLGRFYGFVPMPALVFLDTSGAYEDVLPFILFVLVAIGLTVAVRQWIERKNSEHFKKLLIEFLNRI